MGFVRSGSNLMVSANAGAIDGSTTGLIGRYNVTDLQTSSDNYAGTSSLRAVFTASGLRGEVATNVEGGYSENFPNLFGSPNTQNFYTEVSARVKIPSVNAGQTKGRIEIKFLPETSDDRWSWLRHEETFITDIETAPKDTWIQIRCVQNWNPGNNFVYGGKHEVIISFTPNVKGNVLNNYEFVTGGFILLDEITVYGGEFQDIPLSATFAKTDCTAFDRNDGTITITAAGGSGNYRYEWDDIVLTGLSTRTNLEPGTYHVTVIDNITNENVELTIEILSPAPPIPDPFFEVPQMNSIRFVRKVVVDGCDVFQNFDNTLFNEEYYPNVQKRCYFQKIAKCDVITIQAKSNYQSVIGRVLTYGSDQVVVDNVFGTVQKSYTNNYTLENGYIKNNGAGQSRVYFNSGSLPVPLQIGQAITIANTTSFNGNYAIVDIQDDLLLGATYLIINLNYVVSDLTTSAQIGVRYNFLEFDIYEVIFNFNSLPNGYYYIKLSATDENLPEAEAISEPFHLGAQHPNTSLIQYRNFDNAFDIDYTTGILHKLRVESRLFKKQPEGKRTVHRNSDNSLIKLKATKTRKVLFETYQLPGYMHEKLSVIFDHDFTSINEIEVQTEEGYEFKYIERIPLCNGSIVVEQVHWFANYNSHDTGADVDGGGFIIANGGFLKR